MILARSSGRRHRRNDTAASSAPRSRTCEMPGSGVSRVERRDRGGFRRVGGRCVVTTTGAGSEGRCHGECGQSAQQAVCHSLPMEVAPTYTM